MQSPAPSIEVLKISCHEERRLEHEKIDPDSWLLGHRQRVSLRVDNKLLPVHEETCAFGQELIKIVELKVKQIDPNDEKSDKLEPFAHEVYKNWEILVKLIRRRSFEDKKTGDVLINVKEVDYLCTDAMHSVILGSLLPWADFSFVAALGHVLTDIYSNLSNHVDNRMKDIENLKSDPLKCALAKKEILDILRVRSFRHKNCCNNFMDAICLQNAFRIEDQNSLPQLVQMFKDKQMLLRRVEGADVFVFATPAIINDPVISKNFCLADVNANRALVPEKLVVFNRISGLAALIPKEEVEIIPQSSILESYILSCPINTLTVITKSVIELRQILQEIRAINGVSVWNQFKGVTLDHGEVFFVHFRDLVYHYLASISEKLVKLNIGVAYEDLVLLEEHGLRAELDRSIFMSSFFIMEVLLEIPVNIPSAQQTFEVIVTSSFKRLPNCLNNIMADGKDAYYSWFHIVQSLEIMSPLVHVETYSHPNYFKTSIQDFKIALDKFALCKYEGDYAKRQASILDVGRAYVARLEGQKHKIYRAPDSFRYPDQRLLETKGYWVLNSFGSSKKLLYKCLDQRSRKLVVIKRLRKSKPVDNAITNGELGALMSLNYINIVRYIECFNNEEHCFMVMEYCEDTVASFAEDGKVNMSEGELKSVIRQVINGLIYLHMNHIVHRDIKPGNILKDGRGFVKIADFGEAQLIPIPIVEDSTKFDLNSLCGTPAYMAPECLHKAKVFPSADVWSLGCLMIYLISGQHPWSQCSNTYSILYKLSATDEMPVDIDTLACSDDCKRILKCMLKRNPDERITIAQLISDPFFFDVPESLI